MPWTAIGSIATAGALGVSMLLLWAQRQDARCAQARSVSAWVTEVITATYLSAGDALRIGITLPPLGYFRVRVTVANHSVEPVWTAAWLC